MTEADGKHRRKLVSSSTRLDVTHPVWSPDGSSLAFAGGEVSSRGKVVLGPSEVTVKRVAVWAGSAAGRRFRQLTSPPRDAVDVPGSWSPSGTEIALVRLGPEREQYRVLVVDTRTRRARAVGLASLVGGSWSPDGAKLAVVAVSRSTLPYLSIVDVETGRARTMGRGVHPYSKAAWSPSGSAVAYTTRRGAIRVVDVGSGRSRTLTAPRLSLYDYGPTWSPDGRKIAFVRGPEVEEYTGTPSAVYVIDSGGGGLKRLRGLGVGGGGTLVTWAPASDRLAFSDYERGQHRLHVIGADGTGDRDLGVGQDPVWQPAG
jgi:Tol biopolymer transport system component